MPSTELAMRFVEAFTSKIEQHFDVVSLFATTDEEVEKKKSDREINLTLKTRIRTHDQFEAMLLCEMSVEGKSKNKEISFNCVVTGVFMVKDVVTLMANEEGKFSLTKATAELVYPYMREVVADITKRLPLDKIIKLPPHYELSQPQESAITKPCGEKEPDMENAEEPREE